MCRNCHGFNATRTRTRTRTRTAILSRTNHMSMPRRTAFI